MTWDYRCPFARNAHEHLVTALEAGAPWEVTFLPFTLSQVHVPEGGVDAWDDPEAAPDLLALQAGMVVRDQHPEEFFAVHRGLFRARHDEARDIRLPEVVADVLDSAGVPSGEILGAVEAGKVLADLKEAHTEAAEAHGVFGVPTFLLGDQAVFVRLMTRPDGDPERSRRTIERVLDLLAGAPELNEYKHTTIPR